jgi:hypothetical protein
MQYENLETPTTNNVLAAGLQLAAEPDPETHSHDPVVGG